MLVIGPVWAFEARRPRARAGARHRPRSADRDSPFPTIAAKPRALGRPRARAPCIMGIVNITPIRSPTAATRSTPQAAAKAAHIPAIQGRRSSISEPRHTPRRFPSIARRGVGALARPWSPSDRRTPKPSCLSTRSEAPVAARAVEAGAAVVNDVSGLAADPAMADTVAKLGVPVVIGHRRGMRGPCSPSPAMTTSSRRSSTSWPTGSSARRAGIAADRILVDPGLGFAKTAAHS